VWLAQLDKIRPVVVLTRDPMGRILNAVVTAPVTSTVRGLSTEVAVGPADGVRRGPLSQVVGTAPTARADPGSGTPPSVALPQRWSDRSARSSRHS